MFEKYQHSLDNWKNYKANNYGKSKSLIEISKLDWEETFCIDEIPKDDSWNTAATNFKLWQEDLYLKWGHRKESTRHYMCFEPKINFNINEIIKTINIDTDKFLYNFMKIPVGSVIPWHCDTYGYFVKKFNVAPENISNVKRAIIFVDDWSFGQVIQIGKEMLSDWKQGDIFSWNHDAWHGASNFGNQDLIVMQVTYYE